MTQNHEHQDDARDDISSLDHDILDLLATRTVPLMKTAQLNPLLVRVVTATLTLAADYFQLKAHTPQIPEGIYVQGIVEEDLSLFLEAPSNEFFRPELSAEQVSLMIDLGWQPPEEELPNFWRHITQEAVVPDEVATFLVNTLVQVYQVRDGDEFTLFPASLAAEALPDNGEIHMLNFPIPDDAGALTGSTALTAHINALDDDADQTAPGFTRLLEDPGSLSRNIPDLSPTGPHASAADAPINLNQRGAAGEILASSPRLDYSKLFRMPQAVKIMGRTSSITNSFINSIIPVVAPTGPEIQEALAILGMLDAVTCSYCGDRWTEWDHLRPLVVAKQPTGYISEIHNLVPACGKCNQSKGNKEWRQWMFGPAALSPKTRGTHSLEARAERLEAYDSWKPPTRLDFADLVGLEMWTKHWDNHRELIELMREAQETASTIRQTVRDTYLHATDEDR